MKYLTEEDLNAYFDELADCYKKDLELYRKYQSPSILDRLFIQLQEADKIKCQLSKYLRDDEKE